MFRAARSLWTRPLSDKYSCPEKKTKKNDRKNERKEEKRYENKRYKRNENRTNQIGNTFKAPLRMQPQEPENQYPELLFYKKGSYKWKAQNGVL